MRPIVSLFAAALLAALPAADAAAAGIGSHRSVSRFERPPDAGRNSRDAARRSAQDLEFEQRFQTFEQRQRLDTQRRDAQSLGSRGLTSP